MPRWTPRDDLAVLAAAQGRSGSTWPATVQLPDRGTISGGEARRRFWKLTHSGDVERRSATAGASVASATANNVTAGKRRRNTTSMEERAAAVGADIPPTPSKLRQIIADTGSSAAAKATAKIELHRHQKHVQKIVDRAEKEHASMATLLENGPDVSELVAEFKQRGEPFTFGEIAHELRRRYYPTMLVTWDVSAAELQAKLSWQHGTQAERLCVAGAAYERALSVLD